MSSWRGFYLVYVDEYGNTGSNLADPGQPIFQYFAAVIPSDRWRSVEAKMLQLLKVIKDELPPAARDSFELHGADFFSPRNSLLSGISLELRARIANLVAQIYVGSGAKFFSVYIVKEWLAETIRLYSLVNKLPETDLRALLSPNVLAFSHLVSRLEHHFNATGTKGIVLIDEQEEFGFLNLLEAYEVMRSNGQLVGLIERPLAVDSKHHVLMQGTDVLGYLYGRHLSRRRREGEIEERYKETIKLISERIEETPAVFLDQQGSVILSEAVQKNLAQLGSDVDVDVENVSASVQIGLFIAAIRERFSKEKKKG